jgi:hypothetical protein
MAGDSLVLYDLGGDTPRPVTASGAGWDGLTGDEGQPGTIWSWSMPRPDVEPIEQRPSVGDESDN